MCRCHCKLDTIKYVRNYLEGEIPHKIKGSYSTKIENIILKFIELITEDPKIKILVLSNVSISDIEFGIKSIFNGNDYKYIL